MQEILKLLIIPLWGGLGCWLIDYKYPMGFHSFDGAYWAGTGIGTTMMIGLYFSLAFIDERLGA